MKNLEKNICESRLTKLRADQLLTERVKKETQARKDRELEEHGCELWDQNEREEAITQAVRVEDILNDGRLAYQVRYARNPYRSKNLILMRHNGHTLVVDTLGTSNVLKTLKDWGHVQELKTVLEFLNNLTLN
jgi:hypothetical protein